MAEESVKRSVLATYDFADMQVRYYLEDVSRKVELLIIPKDTKEGLKEYKFSRGSSMVQLKLVGDQYPTSYAGGTSLLNSETIDHFCFQKQEIYLNGMVQEILVDPSFDDSNDSSCTSFANDSNTETTSKTEFLSFLESRKQDIWQDLHWKSLQDNDRVEIRTTLQDKRGYVVIHHLCYTKGDASFQVFTTFENHSNQTVALELLSSFCINEITPYQIGDAEESLRLHRIRSKWSAEGRLVTDSMEDLQLEPSWSYWSVNSERFGSIGSMPVKTFFPFMAVEDTKNDVIWGACLAIESSWQMEAYRRDGALLMCGGLADREFGHWKKEIVPEQSFTSPEAIITVCHGGVDYISQRLTQSMEKFVAIGPKSEQDLPMMFNEYRTTWGLPSHENIKEIVEAIKGKGLGYFVIDCGWFVKEGKPWAESMGDYIPSSKLFPNGIKQTADFIKNAGMKPGIWFEIDTVGKYALAYQDEIHLLKRDGIVLTTGSRRFWDMKQKEVEEDLTKKVIGQLKAYGFEYMKMDYNDTIGIGCDGAESLGESLRQNMEASMNFIDKVKEEIPEIILENCSSGGHKLEPLMMSKCSMASFSDAHECEEIPVIAANLHRTILPRQSQIWAVIREDASLKRIAYILSSTFLGRMCLSGDVTRLSKEQWNVIDNAMDFYRTITPAIKHGFSYFFGEKTLSDRHLKGWQALLRVQTEEHLIEQGKQLYEGEHSSAYVVIHTFAGILPESIEIPLPKGCPEKIEKTYSDTEVKAKIENHRLYVQTGEEKRGIGIYLIAN